MAERIVREVNFYNVPTLFKNVGIYIRVSSGLRPQLDSLANQASALAQKVAKHSNWRLVDIYIDVRSGEGRYQRSEFQRMIEDAKVGKLDYILTKSISRFGRNTEETIQALRELKESRVAVLFDEENLNSLEAGSEFIISVLSAFIDGDNASRRENQLWGIRKRLEDGSSELYSRECYGYRKNKDGELEIYEPEAEVVRMVFELYLSGASIYMIQKHLAAEGVKTARGKDQWSKLAVEKMLTNVKYIGDVQIAKPQGRRKGDIATDGGYLITDAHPAIVSRETFAAVQEERKRRSNMVTDETGTHRKETRYSAKRDAKGNS